MVTHPCNLEAEESEIQGLAQLHSKLEANLGYMTPEKSPKYNSSCGDGGGNIIIKIKILR